MSVRYVSFDPRNSKRYDLKGFVKRHHGKAISEALYRFDTDAELDTFRTELREAVDDDESVFIIVRTKDGLAHGSAVKR